MIAQLIFNALITNSGNKRITFKVLMFVRKLILFFLDPIVKFTYQGITFKIYLSHQLPFVVKEYPAYNKNLVELSATIQQIHHQLKVIDVGANVGDSAVFSSTKTKADFLCIEGSSKYINLLNKNINLILNKTAIENVFLGDNNKRVEEFSDFGTAHVKESNNGIKLISLDNLLQKQLYFNDANLLKIDTDGFDTKIIRSGINFITNAKPYIFFEYDPYYLKMQNENGLDIFKLLHNLGYHTLLIFDNFGRFFCKLHSGNEEMLLYLNNYFNNNGKTYMDIFAIHRQNGDKADLFIGNL